MSESAGSFGVAEKATPRVEQLSVQNYRALKNIEMKGLTPLTVLLGPNGSGKSTIFDVFAFLSECFTDGLRKAVDRRGRFRELRTRGTDAPIIIELKYRERPYKTNDRATRLITYHLAIQDTANGLEVVEEWLHWKRGKRGHPFRFLNLERGNGEVVSGEFPDEDDVRVPVRLESPDILGVNTLGQFADHPRVAALRKFITGWYLSYLSVDSARGIPEAGPQERLTANGSNLPNVIQYLQETHGGRLGEILDTLARRVPRLEKVWPEMMPDGRLLLRLKDTPFDEPIQAKFASDGTLKMLAYLMVLRDPDPAQFIGIEEPENHLHPRLLPELAEECRFASVRSQLMVTTHSPYFVNAVRPDELWVLYRNSQGFTQAKKTSEMKGIREFVQEGAQLGDLWLESHFEWGDPLRNQGAPLLNPMRGIGE